MPLQLIAPTVDAAPQPEQTFTCSECGARSADLDGFRVIARDRTGVHVWLWGRHPDGEPGAVCCAGGCSSRAATRLMEQSR